MTTPVIIEVRPSGKPVKAVKSMVALNNINQLKTESCVMKSVPISCIATVGGYDPFSPNFIKNENPEPSRKRRLDHLTFDEKLKRKKLKNRVAAQTSRDRKKAQMDKLEAEIKYLKENNRKLANANSRLQAEKSKLTNENEKLHEKITSYAKALSSCHDAQSPSVGCSPLNEGPAVPDAHPLLQGSGLQPALGLCQRQQIAAMMKILTLCILSPNFLPTSRKMTPVVNSKNLRKVYSKKHQLMLNQRFLKLMTCLQNHVPQKWWGHHCKTWCPVED